MDLLHRKVPPKVFAVAFTKAAKAALNFFKDRYYHHYTKIAIGAHLT